MKNGTTATSAIKLLKADHATVKELFAGFENAKTLREKKKIAAETIEELKIHATIEEEVFYPAIMKRGWQKADDRSRRRTSCC